MWDPSLGTGGVQILQITLYPAFMPQHALDIRKVEAAKESAIQATLGIFELIERWGTQEMEIISELNVQIHFLMLLGCF
jgi:hypothetical protein